MRNLQDIQTDIRIEQHALFYYGTRLDKHLSYEELTYHTEKLDSLKSELEQTRFKLNCLEEAIWVKSA
jgi:hypothetical protein